MLNELAKEIHENAEDDGLPLRLPCAVGDIIYYIKNNLIEPCTVEGFYLGVGCYAKIKPLSQPYVGNRTVYYKVSTSRFGKNVFLSREAAERALEILNNELNPCGTGGVHDDNY